VNIPAPRRIKDMPLTRLLPNMLTLLSLCSGLTAMRYAMLGHWHAAVLAIVIAGIFDMLDGRVARMLNLSSKFGAELDSLSDAVSFGVAPAFVMYEWLVKDAGGFGWAAVLIYAVCAALRLARFNTMLDDDAPATPPRKNYFVGLSAPGGAGLAITPLVYVLQFGESITPPAVSVAFWLILLGGLMVSRLPTLSLKGWRVTPTWVVPILIGVVIMVAAMISEPWMTLCVIGTTYALSLPCGWLLNKKSLRS
jgi:CDP-diacylglycerol--serine O-phosphatidyltransferase